MTNYYVYAYLRTNGTPYYIGKGKGVRAWKHYNDCIHPPRNKSLIIIMENNLTELGALALERRYINWYGRIDKKTGILRNRTDGGEGATGAIQSLEQRTKQSIKLRGNTYNLGKKRSCESKERARLSMLGKNTGPQTPEQIERAAAPKRGMKYKNQYKLICPHCNLEGGSSNMKRYHMDNCKK